MRIRGFSHQYQVVPPSIIFFFPSHVEGIFLFCVLPGSEVRPWPRVSHAPRPKTDRLEAKQLRICLLSKRVVIPRQKSNSRRLPPKHRPAESSRWFSATGPCQVGVNRASSASFACFGASVPSSSLPSQRGISATARHSTAGVTECSLWRHETSQKPPGALFLLSHTNSFCALALGTRLVSFPLCTLLLLACHHFFNVYSSSPRYF